MMFWMWLLAGILFLFVLFVLFGVRQEVEGERVFGGRVPLDEGEFYHRYFAADGVPMFVVLGTKRIFEKELGLDLSRLHPEDDFATALSFFWEDDLADAEIVRDCEEEFRITLTQAEVERMTNFRNFVNVIWEKVRQKSG
jgi:hypothetical protein